MSRRGGWPKALFALALLLAPALASDAGGAQQAAPLDRVASSFTVTMWSSLRGIALNGWSDIHKVEAGALESFCDAPSCTADDLRVLYQSSSPQNQALLVSVMEGRAEARARAALEEVAGGTHGVKVFAEVDVSSLEREATGDPTEPPVRIRLEGRAPIGYLTGADLGSEQVEALFAMGARFTAPVNAGVEPGNALELNFRVPEPLSVLDAGGGTTSEDGRTATWIADNLDGTERTALAETLELGRTDVVVPEREHVEVNVTLDLSAMDVNLPRLLERDGVVNVDALVFVNATVHALPAPAALAELAGVPALSADALRLGLAAGLVDQERLNRSEDEARATMDEVFRTTFGVPLVLDGGFENGTFDAERLGDPIGTGAPVRLALQGNSSFPFPPAARHTGITALTLTEMPLPGAISFPSLAGLGNATITLSILLPPGLTLELAQPAGEGVVVEERVLPDGRRAVTIQSPGGSAASVPGGTLAVEHAVLWGLLWPVTLFAALMLVAIPTLTWAVVDVRRQARRERGRREPMPAQFAPSARAPPEEAAAPPAEEDEPPGKARRAVRFRPIPSKRRPPGRR